MIDKPIHLVFGGTHLLPAKPDEIRQIAASLRDNWKVAWIAPVHCTGEPAFAILKKSFGDRYLYAGLGTTLSFGATVKPMAESGQTPMQGLDEQDLQRYQELLAQSHDSPDKLLARSAYDSHGELTVSGRLALSHALH